MTVTTGSRNLSIGRPLTLPDNQELDLVENVLRALLSIQTQAAGDNAFNFNTHTKDSRASEETT